MNTAVIPEPIPMNVRTFLHNFAEVREGHEPILVMNRKVEEGVFIPADQWEQMKEKPQITKLTPENIKQFKFKGGGDLSQNIDDIYNF